MRRLLLFRHANAASGTGREDHARPLGPSGRADARAIGARVAALRLRPDLVLCSSALRAVETWDEAGPAFAPPPAIALNDALYLADSGTLLDVIAECGADLSTLMLIGHNPGLHQLAAGLATRGAEALIARIHTSYPAGAVVVLEFDSASWRALEGAGTLGHFLVPEKG